MRALPASPPESVPVIFFIVAITFATMFLCPPVAAQEHPQAVAVTPRPLITEALDESRLTVLKGNTHPSARREFDLGTAPASLPMERMLLVLKHSPEQETALRKLLDDQQDKNSGHYHKWLTPEEFGTQFGPSDSDMQTITSWLQSHGFQVGTTKGRTVLEFSGSASQVQEAFHTSIHRYIVNGQQHWANAKDPSIPAALAPAVAGIDSLHDFGRKRMSHFMGMARREKATGKITIPQREFTFPVSGSNGCNAQDNNCYAVGPYDFATIYGVVPLWNSGIDGSGQHIGIVQDSNINIADAHAFRAMFNLPANDPNVIVDGPDPGILNAGQFGGETEADLDVEWSGAVAKGATIDLVVSADTDTTAGIDLSAFHIIENNNQAIMSASFGECEAFLGSSGNQFYNSLWEQAASQGISVFVSAGDEGSASCDRFQGVAPQPAVDGLAVSGIASTPFNVAVGGTDFQDVFNPESYWNITNDINQASAKSYIPETAWNDSCTNALFAQVTGGSGGAETNCNNANFSNFVIASGGSGGASNCSTYTSNGISITCSGYAKPTWQTGDGVPNDSVRDLPDVSLFASSGFQGNFYVFCQGDITSPGSCDLNAPYADFGGVGGTSASAPALAGIMALVNQATNSRQGNPNYVFYKLAAQVPAAFNDVTTGTNRVPCQTGSLDCTTTVASDSIGIINGYDAGIGYDLVTGLGSVNANTLVTSWNSVVFTPTTTTLVLNNGNTVNVLHGTPIPVMVNVSPTTGTGTPKGDVSLIDVETNQSIDVVSLPVNTHTNLLPGGTAYHVKAHYSGDGTFAPSDSPPSSVLTITPEPSTTTVTVAGYDASGVAISSPFPFGTAVFVHATVAGQTGIGFPTGMVTFGDTGAFPRQIAGLTPPIANPVALNSAGTTTIGAGVINFDAGNHNISASYAGDNSYSPSGSTTSPGFTISPGFAQVSSPLNITISSPGASGSTTVGIITSTNFGQVSFSCAGLPAEATCTSSPVTGSGPNTVMNDTITVTTTAPSTSMRQSTPRRYYVAAMMGGLPLAGIFFLVTPKRRRCGMVLGLLVLGALVIFPGCGGGSTSGGQPRQNPGTPKGTYPITVTATGGSISAQSTFTLTVQ